MGEIGQLAFIRRLGIPKWSVIIAIPISKQFICDDLNTSCKNFGPVTPELNKGENVHPSSISSLATQRHC